MTQITLKKTVSYLVQGIAFMTIVWGISLWQSKNMLPEESPAPGFEGPTLSGEKKGLSDASGKKTVLYFFAPWCTVCKFSSHNIVSIREALDPAEVAVYAVALSYQSKKEVEDFAKKHNLNVPVILGSTKLQKAYRINAFPSVYLIDDGRKIRSRLVGYSTEAGIRLRLFFM